MDFLGNKHHDRYHQKSKGDYNGDDIVDSEDLDKLQDLTGLKVTVFQSDNGMTGTILGFTEPKQKTSQNRMMLRNGQSVMYVDLDDISRITRPN